MCSEKTTADVANLAAFGMSEDVFDVSVLIDKLLSEKADEQEQR